MSSCDSNLSWSAEGQVVGELDIAERLPPVVTSVSIPTGAMNVPPGPTILRVDFSEPMRGDSFSVVEFRPGSAPEVRELPQMVDGDRALLLRLNLAAERQYAFWLNDGRHNGFVDLQGRPLVPYLIGFQTGR